MPRDIHDHTSYTLEEFPWGESFLDLELEICYSISAYHPASMYGGPDHVGWPAEGGGIEDVEVTVKKAIDENGVDINNGTNAIQEKFDAEYADKYQDKIESHIRNVAGEDCRED